MAPRKQNPRKNSGQKRDKSRRFLRFVVKLFIALILVGGVFLSLWIAKLDRDVQQRFAGALWALPAKVYARALEVYEGAPISAEVLERELQRLGYRQERGAPSPGTWYRQGREYLLHVRSFTHWDGREPAGLYRIRIADGQIERVRDGNNHPVGIFRLDAPTIGSFYPDQPEDRILLRYEEAPPLLIDTLLAVEDRRFFEHHGVVPMAILRAALTNLVSGRTVQGGSTITQQLAKNLFLSPDRSYRRKVTEAIMALIMEYRYSKEMILEAYLNEVYLGQDGARAIHGFGLASEFYFGRPIEELSPDQIALLVGMVKGASYYNPRRNPERATLRRNVVLSVMSEEGLIDPNDLGSLQSRELGVLPRPGKAGGNPAFMQLVRQQLARDYSEDDLRSRGLSIFTTLDPEVQYHLEKAVTSTLPAIEKQRNMEPGILESAAVIVDIDSGEIQALVGGRNPKFAGFNRALDSRRQIGSLIKPAIYVAALSDPTRYSLITPLLDQEITIEQPGSKPWTPRNYDNQFIGEQPLYLALAQSRNVPAVRVGMDIGLDVVSATLESMGVPAPKPFFPSALLGSQELSLLQVTQMYHTLATEGFWMPLRAIRSVLDVDGQPLQRYSMSVQRTLDPAAVYLTNYALQAAVSFGTARSLNTYIPTSIGVAGKTGTTNNTRDAWFAGFTGNRLGVVWVGRDDNGETGLTGSSGALPVWAAAFAALDNRPRNLDAPQGITWARVDIERNARVPDYCDGHLMPFAHGYVPEAVYDCRKQDEGFRWPFGSNEDNTVSPEPRPQSQPDPIEFFRRLFR